MPKRFAIITHAIHKVYDKKNYAYRPYVTEMNLWLNHVDECIVIAPVSKEKPTAIDSFYEKDQVKVTPIPNFNLGNTKNILKSILVTPYVFFKILKVCFWADHIHLRCPGNVGMIGLFAQFFFPKKVKTVKYAGNWDPKSDQPKSYRIQKKLLSNTTFTQNCKVLVYGNWKDQTKNIIPFFTATYSTNDIAEYVKPSLKKGVNLLFVGAFSEGKQPLLSIKVCQQLSNKYNVKLNMFGDGKLFSECKKYIKENKLENHVFLHGNCSKQEIKKAYQKSHFLVFISKSEGWPKVVAESMFWGCLPFSTAVSCVPDMLSFGDRGVIITENINKIVESLDKHIANESLYHKKIVAAEKWSRQFTLEKFEKEIKKIVSE